MEEQMTYEETEALKQEVEQLREEHRRRVLLEAARAALESRGIDPGFAAFVLAEDSQQMAQRVEQFDRQLSEAFQAQAAGLAAAQPRDFSVSTPKKRTRGIRRA